MRKRCDRPTVSGRGAEFRALYRRAERAGAPIVAGLETHVQADHVSGLPALVEATGATAYLPPGAGVEFDHAELEDGGEITLGNTLVRVLEFKDRPGDKASLHFHPASVMYTLSAFRRRLGSPDRPVIVDKQAGEVMWLDPQQHSGENVGTTDTHAIFVELKG